MGLQKNDIENIGISLTSHSPSVTLSLPSGEGGGHMSQSENSNINLENTVDNLQDALSLLIILENDLATQQSDEIYLRVVRMIHEILRKVLEGLKM